MAEVDHISGGTMATERLNRPLRGLVAVLASLMTLASISWAANFYAWVGLVLYNEQFLAAVLGLVLPLAYLTAPLKKRRRRPVAVVRWTGGIARFRYLVLCLFRLSPPRQRDRLSAVGGRDGVGDIAAADHRRRAPDRGPG